MITSTQIKPDASVVCSKNAKFATVDHMEGTETIKLKKDQSGQHHYIPLSWVAKVDDKVHLDRPVDEAKKEWSTANPVTASAAVKLEETKLAPGKFGPKSESSADGDKATDRSGSPVIQ